MVSAASAKAESLTRQVVVYFGYLIGLVLVLIGVVVAFLFISPSSSIMGVTAVTARDVYMTYSAEQIPGVGDVLRSRNIIIESNFIPVEVRIRKAGQPDAGSIQVWEKSSGLSFNNVKRTHVEWSQVMVERTGTDGKVTGEVYYKIKIVEPEGIVSRNDGYVFINMYATDENSPFQLPFNFILNTGKSEVKFAADDDSKLNENPLEVKTLEIKNASGKISLPPKGTESFYVNIDDVIIDSKTVTVDCKSPVNKNVWIKCNSGAFTFGDIGKDVHLEGGTNKFFANNIGGNVAVVDGNVRFDQKNGKIYGDVDFRASNGLLSIEECKNVYVRTVRADLTVVKKISGIDFEATGIGAVNVAQIGDLDSLGGTSEARVKTESGRISLYKVWVPTNIESRLGEVRVYFDETIPLDGDVPGLTVNAYDGPVIVNYICGVVDINVQALGNANVTAHFRQVKSVSSITYNGSTNPNRNKGEISVTFAKNIKFCIINIDKMASAHNRTNPSLLTTLDQQDVLTNASLVNGNEYYVNYKNREGEQQSTGNLRIWTTNKFNLFSA